MRVLKITVLFAVLFFFICKKTENIDEVLLKTWKLEWKQCGIYQNKYDVKINFTQMDSLYFGWFLEQGEDTIKFDVEIFSNEKLILTEATDSVWEGVLTINKISTGIFDFEKEVQECVNERYHFK
jgi:hypothetical protein